MPRDGVPGLMSPASIPAPPDEIQAHLARVLASPAFRASKRCHRFLGFIVAQHLAGKSASIKERTLAIEVFDRSPSWDSGGDDTIVRVGAREVRKRLAQYYSSLEGMSEKLRIELPLGSYVPEFVRVDAPSAVAAPPVAPPVEIEVLPPPAPIPTRPRAKRWLLVTALVVSIALGVAGYSVMRRPSSFEEFWAPFLHSPEPLLIALASPVVYSPSAHAWALNARRWGSPGVPVVKPLQLPPEQLNGSDFVPVEDKYMAVGDVFAATNLQLFLAHHSRQAHVRLANRVEFAEFRDTPVILVGAFTNRWTIELTQHFRFHFGFDEQQHWSPAILDARTNRYWSIPEKQDNGTSPEDYFLVCRLPSSPSGTPMLMAAGVEQFGTEAAGRFLADQDRMNSILRTFGKDWQNKKVEFVMHARVIENSPAAPELVASYVW